MLFFVNSYLAPLQAFTFDYRCSCFR